ALAPGPARAARVRTPDRPLPLREHAALLRQLLRRRLRLLVHELHQLAPERHASSESYGIPRRTSRSAQPITPRPIRRIRWASWSISGSGYLLASITLSRKWVHRCTTVRSRSQSTSPPPSFTNNPRFTEPRLHTS